ncbi:MAG: diaminopimelate epimerase [Planctomycetota bacterium]|jgi:diaminopimelate epimerase
MKFTKMHGAGNDYVYVDGFEESVVDAPALARAVSDRHRAIGSDGLILLLASDQADVRMEMYNADGSRAQMCGNGIRCLAHLARDRGRAEGPIVRVETDCGIKEVELLTDAARVSMGAPALDPATLPVELPGPRVIEHEVAVLDATLAITCVSMGNPHAIVYVDDVDGFHVARYGAALSNSAIFPERTNVEFVQVLAPDRVRQRTWERGSGETLACGTGACAVCVAGVLTGRSERRIHNELRGGELLLEWPDDDESVIMTGPVATVFTGEWVDRGM